MVFRTLIIDGNNLAHYLYNTYGRKITVLEDHLLAAQLATYLDSQPSGQAEVILCLDWSESPPAGSSSLRVSLPAQGYSADDDILNHVLTCVHAGRECIVISDDQDLVEKVTQAGGSVMSRYEFVQLPSRENPIFCSLANIHPLPKRPAYLEWDSGRGQEALWAAIGNPAREPAPLPRPARKKKPTSASPQSPAPLPEETQPSPAVLLPPAEPTPLLEPLPRSGPDDPLCRLSLEGWPVEAGLRFLRQSFCKQHFQEHRLQIEALSGPTAGYGDLLTLAGLLVSLCSHEPDFARSGSMMDRVRLALLGAQDYTLPLSAIVARTGLPPVGLRRRLKEKAGSWIEIQA